MQNGTDEKGTGGRATLFAAALILAACGSADSGQANAEAAIATTANEQDTTTTNQPATSSTVAPTTSTPTEPDDSLRAGDVVLGDTEFDMLEPTITLNAGDPYNVVEVWDGAVILQDPEPRSQYTNGLLLLESMPFGATIDEWEAANEAATIESRAETEVGGVAAVVYDISYAGENELAVLTAPWGRIVVRNTEYYRIWMLETDGEKPLALFASVLIDDIDYLDKVEALVATIKIAS